MNALSLPSIPDARLPRAYEAAQTALAQCQEVDECKEWSDKAAALASYAKQAKDEGLERMAQRIRARAIRRAGELLAQIEPQNGGDRKSDQRAVAHPLVSRTEAARDVGFSSHQQKQAVRIASVPKETFEREVEAPKPATLTQLASQGVKPPPKYRRCKACKELIAVRHDDCPNCANQNPLGWKHFRITDGKRGNPTLDVQEGNPA